MGKTLYDYVSNDEKYTLFGLPFTEELKGRSALFPDGSSIQFGDELAVKCDDDLFLADAGGRILLVEELPDESLKALDSEKETAAASGIPDDLDGWVTELCLASGYVLTARFADDTLTLSPSPEPVVSNPFSSGDTAAAPESPEAPLVSPVTFSASVVQTGDKRFLLRFPETGETLFLDARRFLLYAILRGRIVAGFVEIPAKA